MQKFDVLTGVAAPLNIVNIDTDMIIPKQFLKTIKRTGLGKSLFFEMRYTRTARNCRISFSTSPPTARPRSSSPATTSAAARRASTRPGALLDFGIRCVISTSFADIFYNNCFKNGILPIVVSPEDLKKLLMMPSAAATPPSPVDLPRQEIRGPDGGVIKFNVDPHRKHCLLNGLDDIGLTLEKAASIDAYEKKVTATTPGSECRGRVSPDAQQRMSPRRRCRDECHPDQRSFPSSA